MNECKVDGCENEAVHQFGPYGGLCEDHRAERKRARQALPVDEPLPAVNGTQPLSRELRSLLLDLVMVDTLDLDQTRLDAARILLRDERP